MLVPSSLLFNGHSISLFESEVGEGLILNFCSIEGFLALDNMDSKSWQAGSKQFLSSINKINKITKLKENERKIQKSHICSNLGLELF